MALKVGRQIRNPVILLAAVVIRADVLALHRAQGAVGVDLRVAGQRGRGALT